MRYHHNFQRFLAALVVAVAGCFLLCRVTPTAALSASSSSSASSSLTSSRASCTTTTMTSESSSSATTAATATGIAAKLARTNILELQPYRCARDDYSTGIALLDANENAYGSPIQASQNTDGGMAPPIVELHRYPDPHQTTLKQAVATFRRNIVQVEHIFVGVGSDEAIDLLIRIFCKPGVDAIMTTPPTYGMYQVCAKVNDVKIVTVPLTASFDLQVDQVRSNVHIYMLLSLLLCSCCTFLVCFFRCWSTKLVLGSHYYVYFYFLSILYTIDDRNGPEQ
jgi:hypothetical protein